MIPRSNDTELDNLLTLQRRGNLAHGRTNVALAQAQVSSSAGLLKRYAEARAESDRLFAVVAPGALYERPIPERHRIAFYLGHLEAFEWNLFRANAAGLRAFHPEFDHLFAFGIDPVDGGLPTDQPADWPTLGEIRRYNSRIRETLDERLPSFLTDDKTPDGFPAATIMEAAIEHRLMHVETLSYMLHQLPLSQKVRPAELETALPACEPHVAAHVAIPAGETTLGLLSSSGLFGWDNEFEAHSVEAPAFSIDKYKVTNGEYLAFMNADGYSNSDYWQDADWHWKERAGITHPVFWMRVGDRWLYRAMFDEQPLPLDWPVYVSFAEASAYARWAGKCLPTESQWQRAAFGDGRSVNGAEGNFDFRRWDPIPVHSVGQSTGAFGAVGMIGNGWEWTRSFFQPFGGFRPYSFYPGYSANFFDGQHYVMKGASPRTAACMARPSFRNWFQRHYQYVYAGFRCVSGEEDT